MLLPPYTCVLVHLEPVPSWRRKLPAPAVWPGMGMELATDDATRALSCPGCRRGCQGRREGTTGALHGCTAVAAVAWAGMTAGRVRVSNKLESVLVCTGSTCCRLRRRGGIGRGSGADGGTTACSGGPGAGCGGRYSGGSGGVCGDGGPIVIRAGGGAGGGGGRRRGGRGEEQGP
jgi:hypothetical protein